VGALAKVPNFLARAAARSSSTLRPVGGPMDEAGVGAGRCGSPGGPVGVFEGPVGILLARPSALAPRVTRAGPLGALVEDRVARGPAGGAAGLASVSAVTGFSGAGEAAAEAALSTRGAGDAEAALMDVSLDRICPIRRNVLCVSSCCIGRCVSRPSFLELLAQHLRVCARWGSHGGARRAVCLCVPISRWTRRGWLPRSGWHGSTRASGGASWLCRRYLIIALSHCEFQQMIETYRSERYWSDQWLALLPLGEVPQVSKSTQSCSRLG
jgi:hypothetical protein